jgi:hypothetical protein
MALANFMWKNRQYSLNVVLDRSSGEHVTVTVPMSAVYWRNIRIGDAEATGDSDSNITKAVLLAVHAAGILGYSSVLADNVHQQVTPRIRNEGSIVGRPTNSWSSRGSYKVRLKILPGATRVYRRRSGARFAS